MFADDIAKVAVVAIKNSEWHTVDFMISNLYGWMDCPDTETGKAANSIVNAILDKYIESPMSFGNDRHEVLLGYVKHLNRYIHSCINSGVLKFVNA